MIQGLATQAVDVLENQHGQSVDMDKSFPGRIFFEEMQPLEEYLFPDGRAVKNENELHALEISDFLNGWNSERIAMYSYKGDDVYQKIFTAASLQKVANSTSTCDLRASIRALKTEDQ